MIHDIDSKFVKISGLMEVAEILEVDDDVVISLKGSVVKKEIKSNQDGSVNLVCTIKPLDQKIEKA